MAPFWGTRRTIDQSQFTFAQAGNGISFINQPYNFAALKTNGIDFDVQLCQAFLRERFAECQLLGCLYF